MRATSGRLRPVRGGDAEPLRGGEYARRGRGALHVHTVGGGGSPLAVRAANVDGIGQPAWRPPSRRGWESPIMLWTFVMRM